MGDSQQEPDPGQVGEGPWHPPNQNAAIMAEAAPAVVSRSQNGAAFVNGGHLGQGYVAVAAGQFDAAGYQDLRPSFAGGYSLNAANQQDLFQAAHSTYGRLTPPSQNAFAQHDQNDSEAIPAYSTLSADNAAHIITASTVDSSSIQQGYLVLDQDHMVAVQRVVSPADCTVSQSTLSMGPEGGDRQPSTTLLAMPAMSSGSAQYVMQVMPSFASHGEVSTSSSDQEPSVSSLGAAFQPSLLGGVRKVEMECTSGECDTTQGDLDCAPPDGASGYLQAVSLATHSVGMESGGLHTTMMAVPRSVCATVTSADLADHDPIHSGQLHDLHTVAMAMGPAAGGAGSGGPSSSSSGLGRVVDDVAISDALEEAMVTGSGMTDSAMMEAPPPFSLMVPPTAAATASTSAAAQPQAPATAVGPTGGVGMVGASPPPPPLPPPPPPSLVGEKEEEKPSTSGVMMPPPPPPPPPAPATAALQTRKSSRLAQYQREELEQRVMRQQYEPRQYSVQELWCEECQAAYAHQCEVHRLTVVEDRVVLTRAWASLPPTLHICRLSVSAEDSTAAEVGVFAKKVIPKQTQFGPFEGEMVDSVDSVANKNFLLMLEKDDGSQGYFRTVDENQCNWMMFVRPAATYAEQNLVAYQHGPNIFFTVIKNVDSRQELKVWYAAHYAERLGSKAHELTEADWAVLDQQASRFQCSACSQRFRTSMSLQRHLLEHERETEVEEEEEEEGEEKEVEEEEGGGKRGRRKAGVKSYLLKTKGRGNAENGSGYQWKKKTTTMYINKTRKKYQKRGGADRVRQTIKSMYRRRGRGVGGQQEWVCTYCNLTFDNNNVLNLHTLTHAAEDVSQEKGLRGVAVKAENGAALLDPYGDRAGLNGLMAELGAVPGDEKGQEVSVANDDGLVSLETTLACPMCHVQFEDKQSLIHHAAEHAKAPRPDRPFKCFFCWKGFTSKEKLNRHLLCHGAEEAKPLACDHCNKRFMNNSALACHLKTHSEQKYYTCSICNEGYDHINLLKQHVNRHRDAIGQFSCPFCGTFFEDYNNIRKHMRNFHSEKQYVCPDCKRIFPRPDKLKLHMLRHTSHREFMCETCGRQFKRKDKLKEHMKRMHSLEREAQGPRSAPRENPKKFVPKVCPSDYMRFIYKCNTCMLGFKRRGMLVNHLNKRHPGIKPESVHELNLPILKHQKDYYCQHCDKVYKSSSKRKSHILKNHPGAELPPSGRKKVVADEETPGILGSTFSQTIGSVTTMPHGCEFCHKQYASKAKLMQHQRKCHSDLVPAAQDRRKPTPDVKSDFVINITMSETDTTVTDERYEDVVVAAPCPMGDAQADLLTQAMSELITSQADYRQGGNITVHAPETIQLSRIMTAGGPTLLQVQPNGTLQPATIELSQLTQALSAQQFAAHPTQLPAGTTLIAAPSNSQQPQMLSAQPLNISMVTNNGGSAIPVSIQAGQAFVPRTWASTIQTIQR